MKRVFCVLLSLLLALSGSGALASGIVLGGAPAEPAAEATAEPVVEAAAEPAAGSFAEVLISAEQTDIPEESL